MLTREIFKSIDVTSLAVGIFVVAVAALLLMSSANAVVDDRGLITQEAYVLAIDPMSGDLTVQLFETDISADIRWRGEVTLSMSGEVTNVMFCDKPMTFSDIKVGNRVTVTYHESAMGIFADSIDLAAPRGSMC